MVRKLFGELSPRRRRMRRYLAWALSAALVAGVVYVLPLLMGAAGAPPVRDFGERARGTAGAVLGRGADAARAAALKAAPAVRWPAGGTGELALGTGPARATIGGLPVTVRSTMARSGGRVSVQVFDRATANRLDAAGPVLRLRRLDKGTDNSAPVEVTVGYRDFEAAYGGDFGARLRLTKLPPCALTAPDRPECRTGEPLASSNNTAAQTVSAVVDSAPGDGFVLAMEGDESSSQGSYGATSLNASSSWNVALNSGGFSWTYPIRTPQTPGKLGPKISLAYSSQGVDGRTAATNNQGSWLGEGFTYEPGYLERRYKACADDGHTESGDQCWAHHNASVVLDGHSGELIKINNDRWKLAGDDGTTVERFSGTTNGDNDGEYWKVTTNDGTQYFFGLNRLPGWTGATGQEETNSTWTVPVYGDDSGEPCYQATFANAHCDQAWRWNLDYVKDRHGNVVAFFYDRERNAYARGGRTDVDGAAYDRGGYLRRIDYGMRDGQVYGTAAPARVTFTTAERCLPGGGVNCTPGELTAATAAYWPDVPFDLACATDTHCKNTQSSPSFWTRKRLTGITTEIRSGGAWRPVESWTFTHLFTNNGDNSRTLWLSKIGHSGLAGDTVALPDTELVGMQMPNRIDIPGDNISELIRFRLKTIYTDSGGQIDINYANPDCAAGSLPQAGSSTARCYPVKWNPLGTPDPITDWFHKYVVREVIQTDRTGRNPDQVNRYDYQGGAAWRKTPPDGITKDEYLTWSDWRGYAKVTVTGGNGQTQHTRVVHEFLRGMDGDPKPGGGTRAVTVTDSAGGTYTDQDEWSGHEFETTVYDGPAVLTRTVNQPWLHHTATQTESWGTRKASLVRTATVRTFSADEPDPQGGPVWRETRTVTSYDTTFGRATQLDDLGDVSTTADDRCVRTWYHDNAAKHLYSYAYRVQTASVACATTPDRTQVLAESRTSYDGQDYGALPTSGDPTRTQELKGYDGDTPLYATTADTTVDLHGRPLTSRDALGHVTTTTYTDTAGLTTGTRIVNPLQHATTNTIDPAFGVTTQVVDPNGKKTDSQYDGLGRLLRVWLPDRSKDANQTPNTRYDYLIRRDKPVVIKTEKIKNDGTYSVGYALYDGFLRPRQTQAQGPDGGWLLTDTYHTGTGAIGKKNEPYFAFGTAGDLPIIVPEGSVNGQTTFLFDGADRPVAEIKSVAGDERWRSTTRHVGSTTYLDPPDGSTPTAVVKDSRDNVVELHQFHGDSPTGPADVTRYTYTPGGDLATITDPAGNVWRYSYDLRKHKIEAVDPDSGTTTYRYDDLGQLVSSRDARGARLTHVYDALGRKTQTWQGEAGTGVKLSESSYDGLAKGQLHWSARYVDGKAYGIVNANLDALYRPLKTSYVIPAEAGGELARTYDFTTVYQTDGTVQSVGVPAAGGLPGEAIVTRYDGLGRPTGLTGTSSYVTKTSYADTGELLQLELSTGGPKAWITYGHERGTGRLAGIRVDRAGAAAVDMDAQYRYDASGNITAVVDAPAGGPRDVQCFAYDHLRRLSRAWATGSSATDPCAGGPGVTGVGGPAPYHLSWTFDAAGNRRTETQHAAAGGADTTRTYRYPTAPDGQPHTVVGVEETGPAGTSTSSFSYDESGNTTRRTVPGADQTVAWTPEGQVASVTAGGQTTSFLYDALGTRLLRKEPGATTLYLPGVELRLDHTSRAVTATRYYAFGGRTVAVRTTGGVHFQATDHHGTATCSINAATGTITWRRTTPYGTPRGPQPATWPGQKGFVGGTQDPTTGLTNLGARQYDQASGRFLSIDPKIDFKDPQQINGYAYASNNPIGMSDPDGMFALGILGLILKLVAALKKYYAPPTCSSGVVKYCVGPPKEPKLSNMDDDFPNGDGPATGELHRREAKGHFLLGGCKILRAFAITKCADMEDASDEFEHYLDGDGSDWVFDFEEAYREDEIIRRHVDDELGYIQEAAQELATTTGLTHFQMTGENFRHNGSAKTNNWIAALGSYNQWSSADVTVDGDKVTMKVTVHAVDRYNFNHGMNFGGFDDKYFGELAPAGLAKNYTLRGTITREITFTLGSASNKTKAPPPPGRTQDENRCRNQCYN